MGIEIYFWIYLVNMYQDLATKINKMNRAKPRSKRPAAIRAEPRLKMSNKYIFIIVFY
jgi:hypothetical protein